jgi:hypothetical protein
MAGALLKRLTEQEREQCGDEFARAIGGKRGQALEKAG